MYKESLDSYTDKELSSMISDLEKHKTSGIKHLIINAFFADSIADSYSLLGWLVLHVKNITFTSTQNSVNRWEVNLQPSRSIPKALKKYLDKSQTKINLVYPALTLITCGFSIGENVPAETFEEVSKTLEAANIKESFITAFKSGYYGINIEKQIKAFRAAIKSEVSTTTNLIDWLEEHTKKIHFYMPEYLEVEFLANFDYIVEDQDYKTVPPSLTSGGYPMKISYSSILTVDTLDNAPEALFQYLKEGTKQIHNIRFTFYLLRKIGYRFWK